MVYCIQIKGDISMPKKKMNAQAVVALIRDLFHSYYAGDLEPWFSHLCAESVYLGTGEPLLFGEKSIRRHFEKFSGREQVEIVKDEYYPLCFSSTAVQVYGQIVVKSPALPYGAATSFTIGCVLKGGEIKIVYQHNSYEFLHQMEKSTQTLKMDMQTMQFVRELLLTQPLNERIAIKSGKQTVFINPYMVLYIQSAGKHTELFCVDRVIQCNSAIGQLAKVLPSFFYPIHRGYLVNTRYIISIRRFEAELISGITLPIPALNYMQVKQDLKEML